MEVDAMKRRHIPSFGNWDYCEEVPITQYFESASQAGLLRGGGGLGGGSVSGGHLYHPPLPHYYYYGQDVEEDLFKVPAPPPVVVTAYPRKVRKGATVEKQLKQQRKQRQVREEQTPQQPKKQGRVCDCDVTTRQPTRRPRAPKAVDEDLYKIPPELLYQKPRRKKTLMSEFLSRCLGLNCIP
uniref:RPM1-interacting protein 4 n=1 Tax=Anthurium amnicola TaxID=1678845 RepID=A0A1D1Y9D2_9ARAE